MSTIEGNLADQEASPNDLLGALLAESRELTAVERFSKAHDNELEHAQAKHYRDLIPLSAPSAGQQYAFEVDLDTCSGCKACVSACHHMNGLEPEETWRSVGMLYGQNGLPVIQHVTTACHHCVDPGCLNGCPTNAYEKDPDTGIVRHLDDQCFGCQYCTMACPYEVPQYSPSKGIVRKCDMCHTRLSAGEAPACVQACPNKAIQITLVDVEETVEKTDRGVFLPATPPANLTNPTTVYRSKNELPANLKGADTDTAQPQHAHLPLVVMLVLTQLSVGCLTVSAIARWFGAGLGAEIGVVLATLLGLAGLGAATLHLGRPHLAFRSILGWRHSWLSREALVFGAYAPMAIASSAFVAVPFIDGYLPEFAQKLLPIVLPSALRPLFEIGAILSGAAGVFCSAKIYLFTGRDFWKGLGTYGKFAGTCAVAGPALLLACLCLTGSSGITLVALILIATTIAKLAYEASQLQADRTDTNSLWLSAKLMKENLGTFTRIRFGLAVIGGVILPFAAITAQLLMPLAAFLAVVSFVCVLVGELAERYLYFSAVVPLRMPGGVKP